jgi:hypothetical protein
MRIQPKTGRRYWRALQPAAMLAILVGCAAVPAKVGTGPIEVSVTPGKAWLHSHPFFLCFTFQTPPQYAIWIEDENGTYVNTIFVTHKAATQGWVASPGEKVPEGGIRRPESLPVWSHHRGIKSVDGLYMPTKADPAVDAVSGATSKAGLDAAFADNSGLRKFRILAEFNQSLDFNDRYPASAKPGEPGYSGGPIGGSGQPSLVYAADIDLDSGARVYRFFLLGHGAADGRDGSIDPNLSGITTALGIVSDISAAVRPNP